MIPGTDYVGLDRFEEIRYMCEASVECVCVKTRET